MHDIGKNIVGVVLRCNNFEVIDLGVMVPAAQILDTAREEKADLIGVSGLITPSLGQMCLLAAEMERQGLDLPLLIGGATTSRMHTAVKIAPAYSGAVVHVTDASKAVGVAGALISAERRQAFAAEVRERYDAMRAAHSRGQSGKRLLTLAEARANRARPDWRRYQAPAPRFTGVQTVADVAVADLIPYIDWTPFFQKLGIGRHLPGDPRRRDGGRGGALPLRRRPRHAGEESSPRVHSHRAAPSASGRPGAWTTTSSSSRTASARTPSPRSTRCASRWRVSASAPTVRSRTSSRPGSRAWTTMWAGSRSPSATAWSGWRTRTSRPTTTTAPSWSRPSATGWRRPSPSTCTSARARSSGATRRTRQLANDELIGERYRGIRPAPGYPACPDHSEKRTIFALLEAEARTGLRLTESCAMWPASSVCGLYFSHPESTYFGIGKLGRDQVEDYARRKRASLEETEAWLLPSLAYDPNGEPQSGEAQ